MMTLAQVAEPVYLISPWKPVLVFLALLGWARVVSYLDKDLAYYYLQRYAWNLGQMACGVIGFGLMFLIPFFAAGFVIGLLVLAGGVLGYAYYRNARVPEAARWSLNLDSFRNRIEDYQRGQAQKHATLVLLAKDETPLEVPSGDNPRANAHEALENVIDFAVPRGADQITIAVGSEQAKMSATIDGMEYPQPDLVPRTALVLIDYLKETARLDVADRRKKQVGSVKLDAGELGRHTLEILTSGSTRGLAMVMSLDVQQRMQMPLTHLGLLESQRKQLEQVTQEPDRAVLVSAPDGQGVMTTIYSLLQQHDPYVQSVTAFESDVEVELEGISHQETLGMSPQEINEKLAAVLRSDPNVVMLGQLTEDAIAQTVEQAASDVRFYIALRENDALTALARWIRLVGNRKAAGGALAAIISQRLVRKLCPTCRVPYKPSDEALRRLNLPVDRVHQLYHASGKVMEKDKPVPCPDCMGLGYKGRVAVFEVMVFDETARSLVAAGDLDKLRSHLRRQRMLLLNEAGVAKIVEGVTDVKEITRVLGAGKKKKTSRPAA